MRRLLRIALACSCLAVLVACRQPPSTRAQSEAAPQRPELREELLRLRTEDQADRVGFAAAVTRQDDAFMKRLQEADLRRESRLKAIVSTAGWPSVALVGRDGVEAAWLLLQHAQDAAWQSTMLPVLERSAEAGEVERSDVALLTDRVLIRSGRPQRYGNAFSIVGGRMVADPIEDEKNVDARRAALGLSSMADYAKLLAEQNGIPVDWPRKPQTSR